MEPAGTECAKCRQLLLFCDGYGESVVPERCLRCNHAPEEHRLPTGSSARPFPILLFPGARPPAVRVAETVEIVPLPLVGEPSTSLPVDTELQEEGAATRAIPDHSGLPDPQVPAMQSVVTPTSTSDLEEQVAALQKELDVARVQLVSSPRLFEWFLTLQPYRKSSKGQGHRS